LVYYLLRYPSISQHTYKFLHLERLTAFFLQQDSPVHIRLKKNFASIGYKKELKTYLPAIEAVLKVTPSIFQEQTGELWEKISEARGH